MFIKGEAMVLVIGGANIDITGYPLGSNLIRMDSNPGRIEFSLGGVGRNIAENLSLLDLEVVFIGVVGDDDNGNKIIRESKKTGIDMSRVRVTDKMDTSVYMCILDENRDMDIAVCQMGITDLIDQEYIDSIYEDTKDAEIIVLDGNLKRQQLEYVLDKYKGSKFVFDPVSSTKAMNAFDLIGRFYCVKPNVIEAEALTGVKIRNKEDLDRAGRIFHKKGVDSVFITLGSEGTYYSRGKKSGILEIKSRDMGNATGAGDAYMAGLVYSLLKDMDIFETAVFASKCAEMAVSVEETINRNISLKKITQELIDDKN
jgi:pseudouridine kinase